MIGTNLSTATLMFIKDYNILQILAYSTKLTEYPNYHLNWVA